jgi:ABC-type uncharacterized transport system permease subunit
MAPYQIVELSFSEGMRYIPFAVSGSIVLRVAKFPDFGFSGAFLLGACALHFLSLFSIESMPFPFILFFGIIASLVFGGICGLLTSSLFVYSKLNSLISGIITMLVAYSSAVALSRVDVPFNATGRITQFMVGIAGIALAGITVAVFCTRTFLRFRMLCARPNLHRQIDAAPGMAIFVVMILGNGLAGLSGFLCSQSLGVSSIDMADDKMFLALTSLILGESVLSLLLALYSRVRVRLQGDREDIRASVMNILFFNIGANTPFLMCSAIIGPPLYWLTFSGATSILQISTDWNKLFLGASIVAVLISTQLLPQWGASREEWTFQEKRSW